MHPVVEKIAQQEHPRAIDLVLLEIANLVDINKGDGLSPEEISDLYSGCSPHTIYEYELKYVDQYRDMEYEIRLMRGIYCDKLDKARLACIGLISIYMMALHVDNQFLTLHWFDLMRKSKKIKRGPALWFSLYENICACAAIKGGFTAVGNWLHISRFHEALPNYDIILKDLIKELNSVAASVKEKLINLKQINGIPDILNPINLKSANPTKEDILQAKKILNLENFSSTFDDAIELILHNITERINFESVI